MLVKFNSQPEPALVLVRQLVTLDMNTGFARAVLDGKVDGQVWASDTVGTGAMHIIHPYGMSLIYGDRVGEAFDELIERLRHGRYRSRDEWLQIDPRWTPLPWLDRLTSRETHLQTVAVIDEARINFEFDSHHFRSVQKSISTPEGWAIRRAEAADFARPGSVAPAEFWRNAEQFLEHGGGWLAEKNGTHGALAFSSFRFDDELELGIETAPEARGQGLAAAVAASLIQDILDQGLTPVWACRAGNVASQRLAEKLGFRPLRRLPYYRLATPDQPS